MAERVGVELGGDGCPHPTLSCSHFYHRIYIPLPDAESRLAVLQHLLKGQQSGLQAQDLDRLVRATGGRGVVG